MIFRASSNPLYLACPAAAHPADDEILVNRNDDAGTVGTATHEILADWLVDDTQELDVYIQRYNLNPKDARDCKILAAVGRIFWLEWAVGSDAEVIVERPGDEGFSVEIDGDTYSGHTDILIITADTIFVVDWKTTRIPYKDYGPQMKRYCWHAANKYPHIDKFEYVIVFLRDGTCEISQPLTRDNLDDYHADFLHTVINWDGKTYNPGGNCHYCPRTLGCREKITFMQNMLAIFDDDPAGVLDSVSDAQCVSLYQKIGAVQGLMAEAKDNIKARCEAMETMSLEGDEGVNLVISDTVKQAFDMSLARPVLLKYMKPDQLDACCKLGKTLMLDTVSASAPRGKKKEAKLLVMAALKEAKAYEETTTYRIGLKKATKVVESKEIV
jgi:hypothetical protein